MLSHGPSKRYPQTSRKHAQKSLYPTAGSDLCAGHHQTCCDYQPCGVQLFRPQRHQGTFILSIQHIPILFLLAWRGYGVSARLVAPDSTSLLVGECINLFNTDWGSSVLLVEPQPRYQSHPMTPSTTLSTTGNSSTDHFDPCLY